MNSFEERTQKFQKKLQEQGYVGAIITEPSSVYYFTGFHTYLGMEFGRPTILIIPKDDAPVLITAMMELEMAERLTGLSRIIPWTDGLDGEWQKPLSKCLEPFTGHTVGVDHFDMPRIVWDHVTEVLGVESVRDISPLIDGLRMIKSQEEIQVARHAGEVAVAMLEGAIAKVAPGVPEYEISLAVKAAGTRKAAELLEKYYDDVLNFPSINFHQIIASGKRTTMCHHRGSLHTLEVNQPLFLCFCGTTEFRQFKLGFDRTLFVGSINDEMAELLQIAVTAQKAALAVVKPGVVAEDVFNEYAEVIKSAGLDIPFRAGRSLGYALNENPQLAFGDKTVLQEGMVFAVDGAVNRPGTFRAQVGDSIVVTATGHEVLTKFTKNTEELIVGV